MTQQHHFCRFCSGGYFGSSSTICLVNSGVSLIAKYSIAVFDGITSYIHLLLEQQGNAILVSCSHDEVQEVTTNHALRMLFHPTLPY